MLKPADDYFLQKQARLKGCLLALRQIILHFDNGIAETWKYGMPFYCYRGKRFAYLWVHKKLGHPYLGIVEGAKISHPLLITENRTRMKIMLVDPGKNFPVKTINGILKQAIGLYKNNSPG